MADQTSRKGHRQSVYFGTSVLPIFHRALHQFGVKSRCSPPSYHSRTTIISSEVAESHTNKLHRKQFASQERIRHCRYLLLAISARNLNLYAIASHESSLL